MTRSTGYVARVARATPPERDRYVDLLRGVAIVAVVAGHWLLASPFTRDDGTLSGLSVLAVAEWTYWFTWPFQVMPIFFVVGGYANATSWRRHADTGGTWSAWVHRRSVRLLAPTAVFVSATIVGVVIAHLAGTNRSTLEEAGWVAGVALWFLAVYVAVTALTPLTYPLHARFGLVADIVLVVIVVVGDLARFATGDPMWAYANFVLGWVLIHQLGYWWREATLPAAVTRPLLLSAGAAVVLVVMVVVGPWPVSMVDVPGATLHNSSPPSVALLTFVAVQMGIVLAVAERARAWLQRPVVWALVATLNRVVLTLFLWHMVAAVIGAAALYGTGLLPAPEPLSASWFAWRPVWLATLVVIAAGLVTASAPVEQRSGGPVGARWDRPEVAGGLVGCGVPLACIGLARLTVSGLAGGGPLAIPVVGLAVFVAGVTMTFLAGRFAKP